MKFNIKYILIFILILILGFIIVSQLQVTEGFNAFKKMKKGIKSIAKKVNNGVKSIESKVTSNLVPNSSVKLTNDLKQCKARLAASENSERSLLSKLSSSGSQINNINTNVKNKSRNISSLLYNSRKR